MSGVYGIILLTFAVFVFISTLNTHMKSRYKTVALLCAILCAAVLYEIGELYIHRFSGECSRHTTAIISELPAAELAAVFVFFTTVAVMLHIHIIRGDKFDDHIVRYMAKEHNLYIGERTAEELKMNIGTAYPREESITMECRGRDRVTGLPKTVEITSEEMMNALKEPLDAIVEAVHIVLEQTPPELAADISTSGITITGGGALLYGIDKRIQESIGIEVKIAEDPKECVAKGTGESLEEIEKLENNAMNKRKAYI